VECVVNTASFMRSGTVEVREAFLRAHTDVVETSSRLATFASAAASARIASRIHDKFVDFWQPGVTSFDELSTWIGENKLVERVHDALCARCPECSAPFDSFDGCNALTCRMCRAAFCAICALPCGIDAHAHVHESHKELFTHDPARRAEQSRQVKIVQVMRVLRNDLRHPVLVWFVLQHTYNHLLDNGIGLVDLCVRQRLPTYADVADVRPQTLEFLRTTIQSMEPSDATLQRACMYMLIPIAPALPGAFDLFLDIFAMQSSCLDATDVITCARIVLMQKGVVLRFCKPAQWLRLARAIESQVFCALTGDALRVGMTSATLQLLSAFVQFFTAWHTAVKDHIDPHGTIMDAHMRNQLSTCFVSLANQTQLVLIVLGSLKYFPELVDAFLTTIFRTSFKEHAYLARLTVNVLVQHYRSEDAPLTTTCMMHFLVLSRLQNMLPSHSDIVCPSDAIEAIISRVLIVLPGATRQFQTSTNKRVYGDVLFGMEKFVNRLISIWHSRQVLAAIEAVARVVASIMGAFSRGGHGRILQSMLVSCANLSSRSVVSALSKLFPSLPPDSLESLALVALRTKQELAPMGASEAFDKIASDGQTRWALQIVRLVLQDAPDLMQTRANNGTSPWKNFICLLGGAPRHMKQVTDLFLAIDTDAGCMRMAWPATLFGASIAQCVFAQEYTVGASMSLAPDSYIVKLAYEAICSGRAQKIEEDENTCLLHARYMLLTMTMSVEKRLPLNANEELLAARVALRTWRIILARIALPQPHGLGTLDTLLHYTSKMRALAGDSTFAGAEFNATYERLDTILDGLRNQPELHALFLCVASQVNALPASAWTHVADILEAYQVTDAPSMGANEVRVMCALQAAQTLLSANAIHEASMKRVALTMWRATTNENKTVRCCLFAHAWSSKALWILSRLLPYVELPANIQKPWALTDNTSSCCIGQGQQCIGLAARRSWEVRTKVDAHTIFDYKLLFFDALLRSKVAPAWYHSEHLESIVSCSYSCGFSELITLGMFSVWARITDLWYKHVWHAQELIKHERFYLNVWAYIPYLLQKPDSLVAQKFAQWHTQNAESPLLLELHRHSPEYLKITDAVNLVCAYNAKNDASSCVALVHALFRPGGGVKVTFSGGPATALTAKQTRTLLERANDALDARHDAYLVCILQLMARIIGANVRTPRLLSVFVKHEDDARFLQEQSHMSALACVLLIGIWAIHPSKPRGERHMMCRQNFVDHVVQSMHLSAADATAIPDELFTALGARRGDSTASGIPTWVSQSSDNAHFKWVSRKRSNAGEHAEASVSNRAKLDSST
jgi:hypothetical protein